MVRKDGIRTHQEPNKRPTTNLARLACYPLQILSHAGYLVGHMKAIVCSIITMVFIAPQTNFANATAVTLFGKASDATRSTIWESTPSRGSTRLIGT
jgi:hypothetical protein